MTTTYIPLTDVDIDERLLHDTCQWFRNCDNEPTYIVSHPILSWVLACKRCKDFATA